MRTEMSVLLSNVLLYRALEDKGQLMVQDMGLGWRSEKLSSSSHILLSLLLLTLRLTLVILVSFQQSRGLSWLWVIISNSFVGLPGRFVTGALWTS